MYIKTLLRPILCLFLLCTTVPSFSQTKFVELRREISSFNNTRCVNQEFNAHAPLFDVSDNKSILNSVNDSIYQIVSLVMRTMNEDVSFKDNNWQVDKKGIDECEGGINNIENRSLGYEVLFNDSNILSVMLRHDWIIEKQNSPNSDPEVAEQQTAYCFSVDIASNKALDVNSLFSESNKALFIGKIKEKYTKEFNEELSQAGDRAQFTGILLRFDTILAVYTLKLPNNESVIRIIEIPLSEAKDLMLPNYAEMLKKVK